MPSSKIPTAKPKRKRVLKVDETAEPVVVPKLWRLYVLRCNDSSLYCGITNDLPRRLQQHNLGKGARYTKGRGPSKVIKSWPATSLSAALKAERAFKALSKTAKESKLKSRSRKDPVSALLAGKVPEPQVSSARPRSGSKAKEKRTSLRKTPPETPVLRSLGGRRPMAVKP